MTSKQYIIFGTLFTILGLCSLLLVVIEQSRQPVVDTVLAVLWVGLGCSHFFFAKQERKRETEKTGRGTN